ncbi:MAG: DNA translocase FtsK [Gemmatimonadetes bacterium]|nr:DNA translocase FtsK [Gemmatimonadota bacterium]
MLSKEQQQEIIAFGLLALALFVLLSLVPIGVFGVRGEQWFPSGNMMGKIGLVVRGGLVLSFGKASFVVPALFVLGGLRFGGWLSRSLSVRLTILAAGLLVLLPVTLRLFEGPREEAVSFSVGSGWFGDVVGASLLGSLGFLGSLLLVLLGGVVLSVATLGWNPLRALARGAVWSWGTVGTLAKAAGDAAQDYAGRLSDLWQERKAAREAAAVLVTVAEDGPAEAEGEDTPPDEDFPPDGADDGEPTEVGGPDEAEEEPEIEPGRPAINVEISETGVPPVDLLEPGVVADRDGMERELDHLGEVLVEKLKTFNVQSKLAGRTTGPVVTRYEVVPAAGVKVNRIANLDADLALAMKAQSIRIVAPIPGKGAVGVEIPNPRPEIVQLRDVLEAREYAASKAELPLALGKDLTGKPYVADLAKMPHALIAGATGSGKSICINTIVTSLVCRHTPETLRLLMVDPKMVELSTYQDLPHLRHPVVTDPRDAASVLKWGVMEMERRYALLSANGVRSISEFNERVRRGVDLRRHQVCEDGEEEDPSGWLYVDGILPYIVVVIDELADLMMTVQTEVERPLTLLAQKARAIGIHLIVATQRPSVNVITGLIKANFPTRIAFRVASKTDSRTILDQNGADSLLGNGDMLFLPPGKSEPVRIQGAYIATEETDRIMDWYRAQAKALLSAEIGADAEDEARENDILEMVRSTELEEAAEAALTGDGPADWDELFRASAEVCIQHEQGSTSLLQRRLKIGYGRAARIVDQLHDAGILGPSEGSKAREVLVGMDALDAICSARHLG